MEPIVEKLFSQRFLKISPIKMSSSHVWNSLERVFFLYFLLFLLFIYFFPPFSFYRSKDQLRACIFVTKSEFIPPPPHLRDEADKSLLTFHEARFNAVESPYPAPWPMGIGVCQWNKDNWRLYYNVPLTFVRDFGKGGVARRNSTSNIGNFY